MARNVGSIEVTVDANTGRMTAKMRKDGKLAGSVWASAFEDEMGDVSGRELLARLRVIRQRAEAVLTEIDVDIGIDDSAARAGIKRLEGHLRATQLELIVNSDLDAGELMAELAAARELLRDIRLDVEADLDPSEIIAINEMVEALLDETIRVHVEAEVDQSSFAAARAQVLAWAESLGDESGKRFGGGFSGDNTKLIAAAILGMGDALVGALEGAIAAATAVLSSAIQAVGSAALAATPLVAGFGAAITALIVGSQGAGTAMKAINDEFATAAKEGRAANFATAEVTAALRDLTPSAREAVLAFADLRDELSTIRKEVQQELFLDVDEQLRSLADETLPDVSGALQIAAGSVNEFGAQLVDVANQTDFTKMIEAIDPALDDAFDAATDLVGTLEPFLIAAAPAAERLAEMLARGAEGLRRWTENNPTEIAEFLDEGLTSLRAWSALLSSTGSLLATIFDAGATSGDNFVISLNNAIERWDAWLGSVEGQEALAEFFERGTQTMAAMQPILDGLKEAFDILITDDTLSNIEGLADAIGEAIPALANIIALTGDLQIASAFADIIVVVGQFAELVNLLPDGVLELVAAFYAWNKAAGIVANGIKLVGSAAAGMTKANVALLAISAAVTVAMAAYEAFGAKEEMARVRTEDLTRALADNVDAMILSGEVAAGASLSYDAFNRSLTDGTEDGERLTSALGDLNRTGEDAFSTLRDMGDDSLGTLQEIAEGMGLTTDQAARLAAAVDATDDNFTKSQVTGGRYAQMFAMLSDETGLTKDELYVVARAMEEVQDQAENTNLEEMALENLRLAKGADEASAALVELALENLGLNNINEDAIAIYDEYTRLLNLQTNAAEDSTSAARNQLSAYEQINEAITQATMAAQERNATLKAEREAAFDAWREEERLATSTRKVASELAAAKGMPRELADGFIGMGVAARDAAGAADAFSSALDTLFAPTLDYQAAIGEMEAALDDLQATTLTSAANSTAWNETLTQTTEAGRTNAEALRGLVDGMLGVAEAGLASGASAAELNAQLDTMRLQLIYSAEQMGASREEAILYADQLLGVPGLLSTIVEQPGMVDALLNAEDLTVLYDDAGQPVIAEFEQLGIDKSLADSEEFKELLEAIDGFEANPSVTATTAAPTTEEVRGTKRSIEELDESSADPAITVTTAPGINRMLDQIQTKLTTLNTTTVTPRIVMPSAELTLETVNELDTALDTLSDGVATVTVNGVQQAINKVNELDDAIQGLRNKTVTVTTNQVTRPSGGSMAGELIGGPTTRNVGERGYAEAIVPLQLPLNRVDPSVRDMAALLRGASIQAVPSGNPSKTVNNYLSITPQSADPEAVASQIINRAASLALR